MSTSPAHNLAALLGRTASAWPSRPAVALGGSVLHDYRALAERAARLAGGLRDAGCRPGDRVVIVARNAPAYVESLFACWWGGHFAVPVNAKLHPNELAWVLEDSGARIALVDAEWDDALRTLPAAERVDVVRFDGDRYRRLLASDAPPRIAAVAPEDGAWLFYTSGTTGRPKGVVITHANLRAMAMAFLADVEPVAPGDALLHAAPLSHGSGLYLVPHVARGALSVIPESAGFDPAEIAALVARFDRTAFFAAPTMVKRLVESPAGRDSLDVARLKCIVYGGGPMYVADAKAAYEAFGPRLAQIYGQGESPMTITAMDRTLLASAFEAQDDTRLASVGVAQLGIEVRVADADDRPMPAGEAGEILVRGPTVMREYWNNPGATAATLAGGWLHTGDVGALDEAGFLTLKDRSKDLIVSGGSNIYPREVEEALLTHPDVAEVAVVGRRHPEWGEEVVACVVARARIEGDALRALERALDAHCLATIARFKRPRAYLFVDALPRNDTGKVLKRALRDRIASAPPQS
jgi:long-chain acyl-CoA synthetase